MSEEASARVRAAIADHGPITFAEFMEIALYDPERGYYRGAVARPGRAGDFLTAPEASPIFGRTLARFASDAPELESTSHFVSTERPPIAWRSDFTPGATSTSFSPASTSA